jgi:hypothetical protein
LNIEDINPITTAITAPILKKPANFDSGEGLLDRVDPIKNKIIAITTEKITILYLFN